MDRKLSINNPIFGGARDTFDRVLQSTVQKAKEISAGECSVSLKLDIDLAYTDADGNNTPEFKYKVSTAIPLKGSIGGTLMDKYIMKLTDDGWEVYPEAEQTSML